MPNNLSEKMKRTIKTSIKASVKPRKTYRKIMKRANSLQVNLRRRENYQHWFSAQELNDTDLAVQKKQAQEMGYQPLISIILPIYNTPEQYLRECLDSVLNQTYDNWELCIADDASPNPTIDVVKEYAHCHKNIKWVKLDQNMHIAGSSNEALKLASGDFVALLDHDDVLLPNALYESVKVLNTNSETDFIYSDEDKIEGKKGHLEPFFKPDWSPDFLRSCNYITHFAVLRKSIVDKIGGFRLGTEGAQDWDLFLRFTKQTNNVTHIPKILYSWRKSANSTAKSSGSKPYAYINQRNVLRHSVQDGKLSGAVFTDASLGFWRVRYQISGNPKVSIIIPTKDNYKLIKNCLLSIIDKSSFANFEIVLVDSGSTDPKVTDLYKSDLLTTNPITLVEWKGKEFNFSEACNTGAKQARGDYLVFLNNDTEVISNDWIESLLEHAQRSEVGMVGAKLLFPNNTIQHAGVVLSERDIAFHPFYGSDPTIDIFTNIYIANVRNVAAVTAACSMVSKKKFDEVGGFSKELRVTYNDVDLCLKLLDKGYLNVYTPNAKLHHYESMSVGKITTGDRNKQELSDASQFMRDKWDKYLKRDPYYNDNFIQHGPGYTL